MTEQTAVLTKIITEEQNPANAGGCCAPLAVAFIDDSRADALSTAFKAIGNPVRLQILDILSRQPGQVCVCDIEAQFDLAQPTISHHLRVLRKAGLVESEQRGTWIYYFVREAGLAPLRGFLAALQQAAV